MPWASTRRMTKLPRQGGPLRLPGATSGNRAPHGADVDPPGRDLHVLGHSGERVPERGHRRGHRRAFRVPHGRWPPPARRISPAAARLLRRRDLREKGFAGELCLPVSDLARPGPRPPPALGRLRAGRLHSEPLRNLAGVGANLSVAITKRVDPAVGYGYGINAARGHGFGGQEFDTQFEFKW